MKRIAFSILGILVLSGCQTIENFEDVHKMPEPVVTQTHTRMNVAFGFASSVIEEEQRTAIERFIIRHDVSENDEVVIEIKPTGGDLVDDRARKVSAYLKHLGLKPSYKVAGDEAENHIGIELTRYQVSVPDCPDWRADPNRNFGNQPHSNFGCAQASNLALMIGDPRDLLHGQDLSAPDGYVLSNAVRTYQVPRGGWAQGSTETTTTGRQ